jgi:hypothetical protein
VAQSVNGNNLVLKEPGTRGVTQQAYKPENIIPIEEIKEGKKGLNSAHMLADEFMGPGYRNALNLISTSDQFNKKEMGSAETTIASAIKQLERQIGETLLFDLKVSAVWRTAGDAEVIGKLKSLKPDMDESTKNAIADVLAAKQDPRRCEKVTYQVTGIRKDDGSAIAIPAGLVLIERGPDIYISI